MTEYGRGPGSEPWHPEDPLYGDQGWGGQQPAHGQSQYGGQQQPYPQDPYAAQQQPQDPYAAQHQPQDPYAQQQPQDPYAGRPQDPYAAQHQPQDPYAQQQPQDPYAQQQPQDPYAGQSQDPYAQQQDPYAGQQHQQDPYAQQPPYGGQTPYDGGWDTGQQPDAMTHGGQPVDPYGQPAGYGADDSYGTPDAYPPPQPPGRREAVPEPAPAQNPDWDPEVQPEETHPFFTGADDADAEGKDDEYDDDSRDSRRGGGERRGKGKKKSRSGCACLVVSLVLVGGLGGAAYFGYSFYQDKFGDAPDYVGSGSGSVEIEIPKGAYVSDIGNILKKHDVVKSVDAFVSAQNENSKGKLIQAGVYLLHEKMSAAEAVKMLVDPKSQNLLIIPEGTRNGVIYAKIDTRLGLKEGTTKGIAKANAADLGLPPWAKGHAKVKDPLEGFLYPAAYPVTKGMKPESVLKKMVERANSEYDKIDLVANAKKHHLANAWELLTTASLVQAEGKTHEDFRKMAEVVYNRLKVTNTETNRFLQFDSSYNYLRGKSEIKITEKEIKENHDPYNTYTRTGLTPGPIGNPGEEALAAVLHPTTDGWIYFVATDGNSKTEFAKNYDEFLKLKGKFDALD
ncbi:endolytic transglycosylase MltG [Streptomyces brevispora]|uniref:endolytic transglycosylase MltG n=1 Tax=Streptomyces brevispora TaxID=887462 RepID=UPI002E34BB20|nr:endolytic transglycosylase MltG [Streptomyces brevispora]